MIRTCIALALLALLAACSHSARFSAPSTATAVQPRPAPTDGPPYTRQREDEEFPAPPVQRYDYEPTTERQARRR
jgi:hypothetical protein